MPRAGGSSLFHHLDLFIWCLPDTDHRRLFRPFNRSYAPAPSGHQRHQSPGCQSKKGSSSPAIYYTFNPPKLRAVWLQQPTIDSIMLWVACSTTFFGFCRSGEITVECESTFDPHVHLSFLDLAVDNALAPQIISIKLKRSKSDQFMKGVTLVLGRTNVTESAKPVLSAYKI